MMLALMVISVTIIDLIIFPILWSPEWAVSIDMFFGLWAPLFWMFVVVYNVFVWGSVALNEIGL